jgi:uncharacterized protein YodC (DUF2158 family)
LWGARRRGYTDGMSQADVIPPELANEPAPEIAPGVSVGLRSGGPVMTVLDVGRDTGLVWCLWIGADGARREAAFSPDVLTSNPLLLLGRP